LCLGGVGFLDGWGGGGYGGHFGECCCWGYQFGGDGAEGAVMEGCSARLLHVRLFDFVGKAGRVLCEDSMS
jgi:hypothetical protein